MFNQDNPNKNGNNDAVDNDTVRSTIVPDVDSFWSKCLNYFRWIDIPFRFSDSDRIDKDATRYLIKMQFICENKITGYNCANILPLELNVRQTCVRTRCIYLHVHVPWHDGVFFACMCVSVG